MEALLEKPEKEGSVESWNDERLDELSGRMDDGFKEMRAGFDRLGKEMKEGFLEVNKRIDRLMLTLVVGTLGMLGALLGVALT